MNMGSFFLKNMFFLGQCYFSLVHVLRDLSHWAISQVYSGLSNIFT